MMYDMYMYGYDVPVQIVKIRYSLLKILKTDNKNVYYKIKISAKTK